MPTYAAAAAATAAAAADAARVGDIDGRERVPNCQVNTLDAILRNVYKTRQCLSIEQNNN
jgi:hypothetical protein